MLELCGGTLHDVIYGEYKGAPIPSRQEVLFQIASGLHYLLYWEDIIHGDIKPQNILISLDSVIKLSDFGFCKRLGIQNAESNKGIKGAVNWMAPELHEIDENTGKPKEATEASDVFASGLVFFVFLTNGVHPFGEKNNSKEILENIKNGKRINGITNNIG